MTLRTPLCDIEAYDAEAARRQDATWVPLTTGQSAGLIHDLPGAGEVVQSVVRDARAVLASLAKNVRP